jgi:hypothetical protein
MTDRFSAQWRTAVHPIFSILTFAVMSAIMALGVGKIAAAGVLLMTSAAVSAALFYLTLRGLGLPFMGAIVLGSTFLASATFIHWYSYIETYAFAALTVVVSLFVLTRGRHTPRWGWFLASAGALSVTITNWGLPVAAAFFRLSLLSFIKITIWAFLLVAGIACVQRATFPTSRLFFNPLAYTGEVHFLQPLLETQGATRWTPGLNMRSALITSAVVPPPEVEDAQTPVGVFRLVNNQYTPIARSSSIGFVALGCWLLLLVAGVWGAWREKGRRVAAIPIAIYLLFHLAICLVYGEITFLYAGNFFPALLMVAAFGWFTPIRKIVVVAAVGFVIFGGINNYTAFQRATQLSSEIAAHLATTGEALCVPTCDMGRRGR